MYICKQTDTGIARTARTTPTYYDYMLTTTTTDGAAAHLSQKLCAKNAVMERTAPNGSCGGRAKEVLTM